MAEDRDPRIGANQFQRRAAATRVNADPIEIARDLIRCPSVTPAEGGALAYLESVLRPAGFEVHRPVFSEVGTADVENLFATIGSGPPHLAFAGHTDVVPPGDGTRWTHAPFSGELRDGFLYGRGAVDMKGGIAAFVAAALDLWADQRPQSGTLSLLITGDEEGPAVNGTVKLLEWAKASGHQFDDCIVGEPTNPEFMGEMAKIGRRGSLSGTLVVTGRQGHVAYPHRAANPVRHLVALLADLMREPLDTGTDHFDPSNLEFTSVDVGNPTANVIPGEARARLNIRFNDRFTPTSLRAEVERRAAACAPFSPDIQTRIDWEPCNSPAFLTAPGRLTEIFSAVIKEVTGQAPTLSTSGGTSDARFIKDYCPVVEFGLVGKTMHQFDERAAVEDLRRLTDIYRKFMARYFALSSG